jgi:hypothetical protein
MYRIKALDKFEKRIKELKRDNIESLTIDEIMKHLQECETEAFNNRHKDMGELVGEALSDYVNNMSLNSKPFVNKVTTQHRTLQQSTFKLFMDCIKKWSEMDGNGFYDLRNEQTVKLSKKITESLKDEYIPFI